MTNSNDPKMNEKAGPDGAGDPTLSSRATSRFQYVVRFENLETRRPPRKWYGSPTSSTSEVRLSTLTLGAVRFGDGFTAAGGAQHWTTDVDLRPGADLILRIEAGLDEHGPGARGRFTSLDPATLGPTTDPLTGFLPPNDTPPEGQGTVLFSVSPNEALPTGTRSRTGLDRLRHQPVDPHQHLAQHDLDQDVPDRPGWTPMSQDGGRVTVPTDVAVAWSGADTGLRDRRGCMTSTSRSTAGSSGSGGPRRTQVSDTYPGEPGHG